MGILDRLFGRAPHDRAPEPARRTWSDVRPGAKTEDEQALERYRYMIRTAPPETIEQAHAEAFAKLTPEQRAQALRELVATAPAADQASLAQTQPDAQNLARIATRAEMRQPGTMERAFGGAGGGLGMGGMMAGTIFGSLVAGFVGSMVAQQFMESMGDFGAGDLASQAEAFGSGDEPAQGEEFGGMEEDLGGGGDEF